MKRIKAACICQTLHFSLNDEYGHDYAVKMVKAELEQYKNTMNRNHTRFKIVEEKELADGSIQLKIIKPYNAKPIGDYLD